MSNSRFFCSKCSYGTDRKSNYEKHLESKAHNGVVYDVPKKIKHLCQYCNSEFTRKYNLDRHINERCESLKQSSMKHKNQIEENTSNNLNNKTVVEKKTVKVIPKDIDMVKLAHDVIDDKYKEKIWNSRFELFIDIDKNDYPDPSICGKEINLNTFFSELLSYKIPSYTLEEVRKFADYIVLTFPYIRIQNIKNPLIKTLKSSDILVIKKEITILILEFLRDNLEHNYQKNRISNWNAIPIKTILKKLG